MRGDWAFLFIFGNGFRALEVAVCARDFLQQAEDRAFVVHGLHELVLLHSCFFFKDECEVHCGGVFFGGNHCAEGLHAVKSQ